VSIGSTVGCLLRVAYHIGQSNADLKPSSYPTYLAILNKIMSRWLIAALWITFSFTPQCFCAAAGNYHPSTFPRQSGRDPLEFRSGVIVFVLNGTTWKELRSSELRNISAFLEGASLGLMNTKGPEDSDPKSVWVTLGAGRGAAAGVEQAEIEPKIGGPVRVTNFSAIVRMNQRASTQASPGLLGDLLRAGQIERTLVKSDLSPDMSPALIADTKGEIPRVEYHSVGGLAGTAGHSGPSDLALLSEGRGLILISLTLPSGSVEGAYPKIGMVSAARKRSLFEADRLMGKIMASSADDDAIVLLSPSCPRFRDWRIRTLAPIAIRGGGFTSGLLGSYSTRQAGLVANVDFAPTALTLFQEQTPVEMVGRPLYRKSSPAPLESLDALDRQTAATYRLRWEVTPLFSAIGVGILILLTALLCFAQGTAARWSRGFALLLSLCAASPLGLFLAGALPLERSSAYLLATLGLAALVAGLAGRARPFPAAFGTICLITAAAVWTDMLRGAPLMYRSVLGSDPIISGRFYGLGNHEAGLFVAAVLPAAGIMLDCVQGPLSRGRLLLVWLFVGLAVLCLGASFGGANWGQGLAAAVAALAFWLLLSPAQTRGKRLLWALSLLLAAGALFIAIDLLLPQTRQSHLAALVHQTLAEGAPAFAAVVRRKIALAIRVSTYSPLLLLGIPLLIAMIVLPLRPPRRLVEITEEHRPFAFSLAACGMGAVAASLLNDSGIVSGIAMISLPVVGFIWLALEATRESFGN